MNLFDFARVSSFPSKRLDDLRDDDALWAIQVNRRRAALFLEEDRASVEWSLRFTEYLFDTGAYTEACTQANRVRGMLTDASAPATVARTFFARYASQDVTEQFDEREFLARIQGKIADALDLPHDTGKIDRQRIEQIYPRFRCRALFGREISLEARFGPYMMPFLDQDVVAEAMTLPMRLKHAGRFEALLLAAIDPSLARHPSAYGHDFSGPPSLKHRFSDWSSRVRPTWLRQRSYAIQRRLRPMSDEHGATEAAGLAHIIDLEFPAMRRYFRMDQIADSGLWRRIACLEYLAAHLGGRLTS